MLDLGSPFGWDLTEVKDMDFKHDFLTHKMDL